MKQRINNTFNGKILVKGSSSDINTLKDNEIMLYTDDTNNSIEAISRKNGKKEKFKVETSIKKLSKKTRIETSFDGEPIHPIYICSLRKNVGISYNFDSYTYTGDLKINIGKLLVNSFTKVYNKVYIYIYI